MISELNIHVTEDSSSVRINNIGRIDSKHLVSSKKQNVPYYEIDCMIKEISKTNKLSVDEIKNNQLLMIEIKKKWDIHFEKLLNIYLHNRIGFILLSHHQEIFYNTKNAEGRIYPFCYYPTPQIKIVNYSYGCNREYGGVEVINEFDKIIYIFLNNKKDQELKHLEGDFLKKYSGFLNEIENHISEQTTKVHFTDKDGMNHNYTVKFIKYNSDFYNSANYYGTDDKKYIEDYIGLKEVETKIGLKSRVDPNSSGNYYFYECEECLDTINRQCKTCRSKKYSTSFFPLTFQGQLSNEQYNDENIKLCIKK